MTQVGKSLFLLPAASPGIGLGHLSRCLALARVWNEGGGRCKFLLEGDNALAEGLIVEARQDFEIVRRGDLPGRLREGTQSVAVVDRPAEALELCRELKESGILVAHVDDDGPDDADPSDLLVNPNLFAPPGDGDRTLTGVEYAILRPEFSQARGRRRSARREELRLLVLFGGSDVAGVTPRAVEAALELACFGHVDAVLGAGSDPGTELESLRHADSRLSVCQHPPDLVARMAAADLAIGSAGTTVSELACLGVPQLVVPVVGGQRRNAEAWDRLGAAVRLGPPHNLTVPILRGALDALARDTVKRGAMSRIGRKTVDGLGARRICYAISALRQ